MKPTTIFRDAHCELVQIDDDTGEFFILDVSQGITPNVRGLKFDLNKLCAKHKKQEPHVRQFHYNQAFKNPNNHADHIIKYSPWFDGGHDAEYCETCDVWLEKCCCDPHCEYCGQRPERPSQMKETKDE